MNRKPRSSCIDRTAIARAVAVCCLAAIYFPSNGIAEDLFHSTPLTPKDEYTTHIEGPAVNAAGDLFVANIKIPGAGDKGSIGQSFLVAMAEDEDSAREIGWPTFAEDRGFKAGENVVTVRGCRISSSA